jgi:hypothetical protein
MYSLDTRPRSLKVLKIDPLQAANIEIELVATEIDWLTNKGGSLQKISKADLSYHSQMRLDGALRVLYGRSMESKTEIEI